jgi:hypothetical protein
MALQAGQPSLVGGRQGMSPAGVRVQRITIHLYLAGESETNGNPASPQGAHPHHRSHNQAQAMAI